MPYHSTSPGAPGRIGTYVELEAQKFLGSIIVVPSPFWSICWGLHGESCTPPATRGLLSLTPALQTGWLPRNRSSSVGFISRLWHSPSVLNSNKQHPMHLSPAISVSTHSHFATEL